MKFKLKNQSLSEQNEEIIHTKKEAKKHYKPSYVVVLKMKSCIYLRGKFSKQRKRTKWFC